MKTRELGEIRGTRGTGGTGGTRGTREIGEKAGVKLTASKTFLLIALAVGLYSPVSQAHERRQPSGSYSQNLDPSEEYDEPVYSRHYRFIQVARESQAALRGEISERDLQHLFASFQERSRYKNLFAGGGNGNVSPVRIVRFSRDQFHKYFHDWKVKTTPLAAYKREDKTIYVSEELNFNSLAHQSILGHEYIHHLQLEEGFAAYNCARWDANEIEAEKVQREWSEKYLRDHTVRAGHVSPCHSPIIEVRN